MINLTLIGWEFWFIVSLLLKIRDGPYVLFYYAINVLNAAGYLISFFFLRLYIYFFLLFLFLIQLRKVIFLFAQNNEILRLKNINHFLRTSIKFVDLHNFLAASYSIWNETNLCNSLNSGQSKIVQIVYSLINYYIILIFPF